LERIFKRFREIRQNLTENQGITNIYFQHYVQPYQKIFSVGKRFCPYLQPYLQPYQKIFFVVEIAIWSHPQTRFPFPISPINTYKFRGKRDDQAENRIDFCISLT